MIGYLFRKIVNFIKGYFTLVGVVVTVFLLFAVILARKEQKKIVIKADESIVLHLALQGEIQDGNAYSHPIEQALENYTGSKSGVYILELQDFLHQAAQDERVKGIFIELQGLSGSSVLFAEVRDAFKRFQSSGKKIFAWFATADTNTFYLASIADEIIMAPVGELHIPGPVLSLVYLSEAIKRIGVDLELVKLGKYKLAVEPYISNTMSPEAQEMYTSIEKNIRTSLVDEISESTNKPYDEVHRWFEESFFHSKQAHQKGLVHKLAYLDEAKKSIQIALESQIYDVNDYQQSMPSFFQLFAKEDGIAIIDAIGSIHLADRPFRNKITPEQMKIQIKWALENDRVKAVVLRVSSPGGSALASDLIWDDLKQLAKIKPLVVSMGTTAASGGYYISAAATKIFASPHTLTGSIGVFGVFMNVEKFQEKYGVHFETITQSKRKDLFNLSHKMSVEDKEAIQEQVKFIYDKFLDTVALGRNIARDKVDYFAQGRVWTGLQAKEIGLIDEIGGFYQAIEEAKKLAAFPKDVRVPILRWSPNILSLGEYFNSMLEIRMNLQLDHKIAKTALNLFSMTKDDPLQMLWLGNF